MTMSASRDYQEHSFSEWPIFPESDYRQVHTSIDDLSLRLPPGTENIDSYLSNEVTEFINNGMRYYVGAIIMGHSHLQPRILFLNVLTDGSYLSTMHDSIPMFPYQKWQNPIDILSEQIRKMFRFDSNKKIENLSEILGSTIQSITETVSPTIGPVAPVECSAIDELYNDILSLPETSPIEDNKASHIEDHKQQRQYSPFIGCLLCNWWIVDFGQPPVPYLPLHISRPKIQIRLYQVVIPPECEILLPGSARIKFVSFDSLISSGLGPAYKSLPLLISKFSLRPYVTRPLDATPSFRCGKRPEHNKTINKLRIK